MVAADGDRVNVGCWGLLAVFTAHNEMCESELFVQFKDEAASASFAPESFASNAAAGARRDPGVSGTVAAS